MSENDKSISWVITDGNISVSLDGKTYIVARTDAGADKIIDALRNKRYDEVPELVSLALKIERYTEGNFKIVDGEVMIDDQSIHGSLATKIKEFHEAGLDYEPLVKFARKVNANPLPAAVEQLFEFLETNKHPITADGDFIGYKTVQKKADGKMYDWHTGRIEYKLGEPTEMPRAEVQWDASVGCAAGLHIANWHYASSFMSSGIMLKCVISPTDVISVPIECEKQKMRCCRITPVEIIEEASTALLEEVG